MDVEPQRGGPGSSMTDPDNSIHARGGPRRGRRRRWTDRVLEVRRRYTYGIPAVLLLLLALLGFYSAGLEPDRLIIRHVKIPVPGWQGRPLRVAVLGDIHAGAPHITRGKLEALVRLTNRQNPDLIALLGDYVILGVLGGHFMEPEEVAEGLRGFNAPLGVFAVLGNHDWWYNGPRMKAALEKVGYRVLEDEIATVELDGRKIWVAGLADEWTRRPDVEKVMGLIPAGAPAIVLTHGPDLFPRLRPFVGVTLAAHTHGGQVRLPFMGAPIVPSRYRQRYVSGWVREEGKQMYVTSGIGTSILPIRFRVPPEIVDLTIQEAPPR